MVTSNPVAFSSSVVLPFPAAPREPPAAPREPASSAQPRRTVAWVIEWFLQHDVKMQNLVARKERARVLAMFCDHRNSRGQRIGDAFTDECIGADLVEFLNCHPSAKARWTRKRWVSTVKRPFNYAAKLGLIPGCPFSGVSAPIGKRGRDLTQAEFQALLRVATPFFRRVLIFLRFSGARPAELRNLEWSHVRELAKAIVQQDHKTALAGNDPRPRRIQLNSVVLRLLAWIKRRSQLFAFATGPVFTNACYRRWTIRALCNNLAEIRERAGLPADAKLYGCRHMYATGAILNGVDLATLAELMGHASTKTTEWYLHLAGKNDHLSQAAERAVRRRPESTSREG